jgi:FixJ family two-component response regulator
VFSFHFTDRAMNRVHVVDDDAAVRDSLAVLLETEQFQVRTYADAAEFLGAYQPSAPECLILDLRMPGMSGVQLQTELARRALRIPVIFLTAFGDIPTSVRAIKEGAIDFLTKPVQAAELLERVKAALSQNARAARESHEKEALRTRFAELSAREREVLELAVAGLRNKDIARKLGISHRTVEIHRAHLLHKTGATNLLELARLAQNL